MNTETPDKYAQLLIDAQKLMNEEKKYAEACVLLQEFIDAKPNELEVRKLYANGLIGAERFTDAVEVLKHNMAIDARDPSMALQIAILCDRAGDDDNALIWFNRAVEIDPHYSAGHWARGFFLLRRSEKWPHVWKQGLADYEWSKIAGIPGPGIVMPVSRPLRTLQPQWDGTPIPGKRLYVTNEQGAGDMIQSVRFIKAAKERSGATIILECAASLLRLFQTLDGPDMIFVQPGYGSFAADFDEHVSAMSLPHVLGLTIEDIEKTRVHSYFGVGDRVLADRPKVGVCWKGNPQHPADTQRSIPYEQFQAIYKGVDADWISLQYKESPFEGDTPLEGDFLDTAKRMLECNTVVTVDSSVAHLAGALGVPCMMLAYKGGDWRWFDTRLDSIWYRKVCLYRQQVQGSWKEPLEEVNRHLRQAYPGATSVRHKPKAEEPVTETAPQVQAAPDAAPEPTVEGVMKTFGGREIHEKPFVETKKNGHKKSLYFAGAEKRPLFLQLGAGDAYIGMLQDHKERHASYCRRNGYDFEPIGYPHMEGGQHFWYRIPLIIDKIKSGKWSHLFVLDADVIVTDFSKDMRETLPEWAWLAMCIHPYPCHLDMWHLNGGAMYIRCCDESLAFFEHVLARHSERQIQRGWVDQAAIMDLLINGDRWQSGFNILSYRYNANMHDGLAIAPIVAAFHGWKQPEERRKGMQAFAADNPYPSSVFTEVRVDASQEVHGEDAHIG